MLNFCMRLSDGIITRMTDSTRTCIHDDVIKWKHFPRYWSFVRGIDRSTVNSPHKGQWRGAWMFSLIRAWTNGWVNNGDAGDLRRRRAHFDVTVMYPTSRTASWCFPNWPLTRYVMLRAAHASGMPETLSLLPLVSDSDMHHGTCVTHVPWWMPGLLTSGFLWSRWRGKRSRHSRRMRNPQFYASGKRPISPWRPLLVLLFWSPAL